MCINRTSLVVGSGGQDGTLLQHWLQSKNVPVLGLASSGALVLDGVALPGPRRSVCEPRDVAAILSEFQPTEIYYLAGYHVSSEKRAQQDPFDEYRGAQNVHVLGLLTCLEAMRRHAPSTKLFYAASSLIFAENHTDRINESTPWNPQGIYGQSKAQGLWLCREYKNRHRLHCTGGILFNHESPLRPVSFVSRKIARAAARIKLGHESKLAVASLNATVDWSDAEDFVAAFAEVLTRADPGEYVFASGVGRTIRDFLDRAFGLLNLDWRQHVEVGSTDVALTSSRRIGNPAKLERAISWQRKWTFESMVEKMVAHDLALNR